jgi:hypothetical protein
MRGDVRPEPEDCLECKVIGSGAMFSLSGYFVYLRSSRISSATAGIRSFNGAMSLAFAAAGVARLFADDIRRWVGLRERGTPPSL